MADQQSIAITRRRLLQTAIGGGAMVALSACVATPGSAPSAAPLAQTQAGAPTAASAVKQTWTVASDVNVKNIDFVTSDFLSGIEGHIYDMLVDTVGFDFKLVGRLAERWEQKDPTTLRFYLRKGVKFHNGDELTADDVKYSLEFYNVVDRQYYPYVAWIDKVNVVDRYTVDVLQKRPNIVAIYDLCRTYIGSKAARESNLSAYEAKPIGSGPYQVDSWAKGDRLTLKAFPDYWRGVAVPQTLIFRQILDSQTAAAELQSGGVDIATNLEYITANALKQDPNIEIVDLQGANENYNRFLLTQKPLDDPRVRQALNYALDRDTLINKVFLGYGQPQAGPFAHGWLGYDPDLKPYPFDAAKAKQLLAQAGYPDGLSLQLNFDTSNFNSPLWKQLWEAVASQLKTNAGVQLEIDPTTATLPYGPAGCQVAKSIEQSWWGVGFDPSTYIDTAINQVPCFQTPEATEAWNKAVAAPDLAARGAALKEFGRVVHDQAMWLEIIAFDYLIGKRKEGITYKAAPYSNGQRTQQYFDVSVLKPLAQ
jgi:peptide/nickel transport system substrate-binding protein